MGAKKYTLVLGGKSLKSGQMGFRFPAKSVKRRKTKEDPGDFVRVNARQIARETVAGMNRRFGYSRLRFTPEQVAAMVAPASPEMLAMMAAPPKRRRKKKAVRKKRRKTTARRKTTRRKKTTTRKKKTTTRRRKTASGRRRVRCPKRRPSKKKVASAARRLRRGKTKRSRSHAGWLLGCTKTYPKRRKKRTTKRRRKR